MAIWVGLGGALAIPLALAALSPLLAWRDPVYIIAGLAGVVALGLLLVQPFLILGVLPGLRGAGARRAHRVVGAGLFAAVVVHVGGLWLTSPPDVVDALTFTSPTPFSPFGVVAMWAVFGAALVAVMRRRLRRLTWLRAHGALIATIVVCTIVHALLIEGTMEEKSKIALSVLVAFATSAALHRILVKRR